MAPLRALLASGCAASVAGYRRVEPRARAGLALSANTSGNLTGHSDPHDDNDRVIEAHRQECKAINYCYCIKDTPCGWCETHREARVSNRDGPADSRHCPKWITWAKDCPVLHCSKEGWEMEVWWWIDCSWFPMLCFLAWLFIYTWRDRLRARHRVYERTVEETAKSVSFVSGHGIRANDPDGNMIEDDGLTQVERQNVEFFGPRRSLATFKKGLQCPASERLPNGTSRPFELSLSDLSAKPGENYEKSRVGPHEIAVTLRIAVQWRTALGATLSRATGLMFISSVFLMILRNCVRRMQHEDYATIALLTQELGAVVGSLQGVVSLLLSFYALQRVGWYWRVMEACFTVQGRSHDLSMICGAGAKRETDADWKARYTLYRYIMLAFFFGLQPYTPKLRFAGYAPLIKCGLLEPAEAELLKGAHRGPGTVVESWIAAWVEHRLSGEARQQSFHTLRELRGSTGQIGDLIDERAPVSFESLLYVTVYALCVILPFAPSHIDYENREAVMQHPHCATVLGIAVVCSFYLSLLHMLRHLQAPFDDIGAPNDALCPIALMNLTERKLRDYLSASLPAVVWLDEEPGAAAAEDLGVKVGRSTA